MNRLAVAVVMAVMAISTMTAVDASAALSTVSTTSDMDARKTVESIKSSSKKIVEPDFAFPKTVAQNAESRLNSALKSSDGIGVVRSLIDYTLAQNAISSENMPKTLALVKKIAVQEKEPDIKALLNLLTARLYYEKYISSKWIYDERELPLSPLSDDVDQWSGDQFRSVIGHYCSEALADKEILKVKPLKDYAELIDAASGDVTYVYFPTLMDFVSYSVIDLLENLSPFYDCFSLVLLSPRETFVFGPRFTTSGVPAKTILDLYADLLQFHSSDTAPLIYADLSRLEFVYHGLYDSDMDANESVYRQRLYELYRQYAGSEYSGDVLNALIDNNVGSFSMTESGVKEFFSMLTSNISKYPGYWRINCLKNAVERMSGPDVTATFPTVAAPGRTIKVHVNSVNANKIKLNLYAIDAKILPEYFQPGGKVPARLVSSYDLMVDGVVPFSGMATAEVTIPSYGYYYLDISVPGIKSNRSSVPVIHCTDLAIGSVGRPDGNAVFVVDPQTGKPQDSVEILRRNNREDGKNTHIGNTDSEGVCSIDDVDRYQLYYPVKGADRYASPISYYPGYRNNSTVYSAQGYTSLPIYHPGDSVEWAALLSAVEPDGARSLLRHEQVEAVLFNANYIPVDTLGLTSDAYGRVRGVFNIAEGELTGNYSVRLSFVDKKSVNAGTVSLGSFGFTVSDYKLPTFKIDVGSVLFDMPAEGDVTLSGTVTTYSGVPLGNTPVNLTLEASRSMFWWQSNFYNFYSASDTTDTSGKFTFVFSKELLDNSPAPDGRFRVMLQAVSNAGESQQASTTFFRGKAYRISSVTPGSLIPGVPFDIKAVVSDNDGKTVPTPVLARLTAADNADSVIYSTILTDTLDKLTLPESVPTGCYDLILSTPDLKSEPCSFAGVMVYRPHDRVSPSTSPLWLPEINVSTPTARTKISYAALKSGQWVLYSLYSDSSLLEQRWIKADAGMNEIEVTLPEGVYSANMMLASVIDYDSGYVNVRISRSNPRSQLRIAKESFRNKILPGAGETWTFRTVDGADKAESSAVIARMYNSAFDALSQQPWKIRFGTNSQFNLSLSMPQLSGFRNISKAAVYKSLGCPNLRLPVFQTYGRGFNSVMRIRGNRVFNAMGVSANAMMKSDMSRADAVYEVAADESAAALDGAVAGIALAESVVVAETTSDNSDASSPFEYRDSETPLAFFRPMLSTDASGQLKLEFNVPDANTTWRFDLLAYTDRFTYDRLSELVTANKPVMVQPNLPRFLRIADTAVLMASVFNNSEQQQSVDTHMEIFDPVSGKILFSSDTSNLVPAGGSVPVQIKVTVPADLPFVGYRIKSSVPDAADGEQSLIPILPVATPVIETQPFYISPDSTAFSMPIDTLASDASDVRYTLQMCDNPTWYVVTALPGLTASAPSTPLEAASAIFSAGVADGLLRAHPQIREALKQWTSSDRSDSTLISMLERNQDLKTMLLQATPWMLDARSDTERMQRLALLFDRKEIDAVYAGAIATLRKLVRDGGGWAWISQMDEASEWATYSALSTLGSLNRLGWLPADKELDKMIVKALAWHQTQVEKTYKRYPSSSYLSFAIMRDMWPDVRLSLTGQKIFNAQLQRVVREWKKYSVALKAQTAPLLYRHGYRQLAGRVLASLREYALSSPEKGMWWPSVGDVYGGSMAQLSIAADALTAFHLIDPDGVDVDAIRQWLILQKEARNWGSSATASHVIAAILSTSEKWIQPARPLTAEIGGKTVETTYTDATLGYFRTDVTALSPSGATLTVNKTDLTPAWGALYVQSVRPVTSVKASKCDAVSIEKRMFRQVGHQWEEATDLHVGDRVKIQLLIKADREMQYVAIDDDRSACLEPVEQLPAPIFAEGLCFYRENRDASTNIFVSNMPRGTYLLEYEMWVTVSGAFSSGIATLQSQYAPGLSAHSAGTVISVASAR